MGKNKSKKQTKNPVNLSWRRRGMSLMEAPKGNGTECFLYGCKKKYHLPSSKQEHLTPELQQKYPLCFPYVGFSAEVSEVPSPSSPSVKDQNTLLRQHKKSLFAIAPSILHSSGILLFPDPSVWHYFVYLHAPIYTVKTFWANTPQNTSGNISVLMSAGSPSRSVDINTWL